MSYATFAFAWSCLVWYCVCVPRMNHGRLALLRSSAAPVTGVPGLARVGALPWLTKRVANVSGWLSLSVWLKFRNHDQSPLRLPTEVAASQEWKVWSVLYRLKGC